MTDLYIKLSDAVALAEKSGLPQLSVDELRALPTYPAPDRDAMRAEALLEAANIAEKVATHYAEAAYSNDQGRLQNAARVYGAYEIKSMILALIPTPASHGVTAGADVAALQDPIAVHANMLRGTIAMPSVANIIHLYGADALRAALIAQEGGDAAR